MHHHIQNGGADAFSPTQVAGITAWYDFSDATTLFTDAGTTPVSADGNTVYQVNDKTANGYNLQQSTSGDRPVYKVNIQNGLSVIRAAATTEYLTRASTPDLTQPTSIFVVMVRASGSGYAIAVDGHSTLHWVGTNGTAFRIASQTESANMNEAATNNWSIYSALFNNTGSSLKINGGATKTGTTGTNKMTGIRIGAASNLAAWIGDIGEVIIYNAAVSAADRLLVESYLNAKWAVY